MIKVSIAVRAKLRTHSHPVIDARILMRDEAKVIVMDGKMLTLKAGEPIVEVVNIHYCGVNERKDDAEIIVFCAGIVEEPMTI